jgi:hypothetical protein
VRITEKNVEITTQAAESLLNACLPETDVDRVAAELSRLSCDSENSLDYGSLTGVCYHDGYLIACNGTRWISIQIDAQMELDELEAPYVAIARHHFQQSYQEAIATQSSKIDITDLLLSAGIILPRENIFKALDKTEVLAKVLKKRRRRIKLSANQLLRVVEAVIASAPEEANPVISLSLLESDRLLLFQGEKLFGSISGER